MEALELQQRQRQVDVVPRASLEQHQPLAEGLSYDSQDSADIGAGGMRCLNIETYRLISPLYSVDVVVAIGSLPEPSWFVALVISVRSQAAARCRRRRRSSFTATAHP